MADAAQNTKPLNKMDLEKLIQKIETLPTLPNIIFELNRLINNPLSSANNVAKVMERDQSLTAKVLQLVNSAYYAIPGGVANLQRAIAYLGFDTINQLILSASVFKTIGSVQGGKFNLNEFWKHAIGVAMAAEILAKRVKNNNPSNCFTAGLLHDLGKIAMNMIDPNHMDQVVEYASTKNISVITAELEIGIVPHTVVGSLLAKKWKLPSVISESILFHHEVDAKKRGPVSVEISQTIDIVLIANNLIHELQFGGSGHNLFFLIDDLVYKRILLNPIQLPLILKDIKNSLENAEAFLKIISG